MSQIIDGQLSFAGPDLHIVGGTDTNAATNVNPEDPFDAMLPVTTATYLDTTLMNHSAIFAGFDTMHIITYSYGLKFLDDLFTRFNIQNAEIVIGFPHMVGINLAELTAKQIDANDSIFKSYRNLAKKVRDGSVHFYVMNADGLTHEKVFMMKSSETGAVRVLIGSANATKPAFDASQGETYVMYDNQPAAYAHHMERFRLFRDMAAPIEQTGMPIIEANGNINFENIPIAKQVQTEGAVIIDATQEDPEYIVHINNINKIKAKLTAMNIKPDKNGKIELKPKKLTEAFQRVKKRLAEEQKKKQRIENPPLIIDYDNRSLSFNGEPYDLHPDMVNVAADLEKVNRFFAGFNTFYGNTSQLKFAYWKLMNYMFCSVFLSKLRTEAALSRNNMTRYPGLLLLRGPSGAAKSHIVPFFQQMIIGHQLTPLPGRQYFLQDQILGLREQERGLPLMIEEVQKDKFQDNGDKIAKLYEEGFLAGNEENEPVFILCSNEVGAVSNYTSKRMITLLVDAYCPKKQGIETYDEIGALTDSLTTAAYSMYCGIMFSKIDDIIDATKNRKPLTGDTDIYYISSQVLLNLYAQAKIEPPEEFKTLSWEDFLLTDTSKARDMIQDEYIRHPDNFHVDRVRNEMTIDFTCYAYTKQKSDYVNTLCKESPESWQCRQDGNSGVIVRDLRAAEEGLGITFKNRQKKWKLPWNK